METALLARQLSGLGCSTSAPQRHTSSTVRQCRHPHPPLHLNRPEPAPAGSRGGRCAARGRRGSTRVHSTHSRARATVCSATGAEPGSAPKLVAGQPSWTSREPLRPSKKTSFGWARLQIKCHSAGNVTPFGRGMLSVIGLLCTGFALSWLQVLPHLQRTKGCRRRRTPLVQVGTCCALSAPPPLCHSRPAFAG